MSTNTNTNADIQQKTDSQLAHALGVRKLCVRDYIHQHRQLSEQVAQHDGGLIDLDCMVELERVLGKPITYELYQHIDNHYDFCLLEVLDCPDRTTVEREIKQYAAEYETVEQTA